MKNISTTTTTMSNIIDYTEKVYRNKKLVTITVVFCALLIFLFCHNSLRSQNIPNEYIINNVEFVGNQAYSDSDLKKNIVSKETSLSIFHEFLEKYHKEALENPYTPNEIITALKKSLIPFEEEYSLYDKDQVANDKESIINHYNKNGFHQVEVQHSFGYDSLLNSNTLKFYLDEGSRFKVGSVKYLGLETLEKKLATNILNLIKIDSGDYFRETKLIHSAINMNIFLKNNGYYFSEYEILPISKDTSSLTDDIEIKFKIGKRVKFGDVKYFDILSGQKTVVKPAKLNQLAWKKGDWVSLEKIDQSTRNLLSLGTFNYVSIDTNSSGNIQNDSLLNFVIVSRYRKLRDWESSVFYNRTENSIENGGIGGELSHRNMFGKAEHVYIRSKILFQDPTRQLNSLYDDLTGKKPYSLEDKEFKISLGYSNPSLFSFDWQGVKAKANVSLEYSIKQIKNFFTLNSFRVPFIFPLSFKKAQMSIKSSFAGISRIKRQMASRHSSTPKPPALNKKKNKD